MFKNLLLVLVFDRMLCLYLPYTLYTRFSSCRKCSRVKDKQNGHRPDTESCHNTEDRVCKMEIKEKRERTCCRKRFSNFCKINKQPRISVNARVFCLKKKDAIEPGMKLFIVPSFFFYTSRRHDKWKILSQESKV